MTQKIQYSTYLTMVMLIIGLTGTSLRSVSTGQSDTRRSAVLSKEDSSMLLQVLTMREYHIHSQGKVLQSPNRAGNMRFTYSPAGFEAKARLDSAATWKIAMSLTGIGRSGNMTLKPAQKTDYTLLDNHLIYYHKGFDVEYLNTEKGMRQNFIVHQPVSGTGELQVSLAVESSQLQIQCADNILSGKFEGREVYCYRDLKVWDAAQRPLNARMVYSEGSLILSVDDRNAVYPVTIDPLSTKASIRLEKDQSSASFGFSVASAGDVNGDGYSDVIVGAYQFDDGQTNEGAAFIFHGSATGISATVQKELDSDQAQAQSGFSVSSAGDVNGDGYSDVIVGAHYYDMGSVDEGAAFVFHGSASGIDTTIRATLQVNQDYAYMGRGVSTAGDVNNDGYSDVIVGADYFDNGQTNEGAAFVYHGSSTGINTTIQAQLESNQANAKMGYAVASAGDVNGDRFSDVIVGAYEYDNGQTNEGAAFVYHGSSTGINTTIQTQLESNQADANFGISVSSGGDIDGDGYSDVICGAPFYDNGQNDEGVVLVYHGSSSGISSTIKAQLEINQDDAYYGFSLRSAGDINGDGYADLVIGANSFDNGSNTDEGRVYIYHGSASGIDTAAKGFMGCSQSDAYMGFAVASAGDVNGDGYSDVICGAPYYDNGQTNEGAVYIYHGSAGSMATSSVISIEGNQTSANMGMSLSCAGDVNSDGYSDVIVGVPKYDNGHTDEGIALVFHGSSTGISSTAQTQLEINSSGAYFGISVAGAGDVNGDGYSDVVVGAGKFSNGSTEEGGVFVFHGSSSGITTTIQTQLESNQANAHLGNAVASAGDVNADGYSDIIAGAPDYDNGQTNEGATFIYLGTSSGVSTTIHAQLEINQTYAYFGIAVACAGDVNGDGYTDVVIGATGFDNGESNEGAVFIYHGAVTGLNTTLRRQLESNQVDAAMGVSVSSAGDVNGDSYSDIVVGIYGYDNSEYNEGTAWVYHGASAGIGSTPAAQVELNTIGWRLGSSVSSGGDVNGDGYSDILVSAPNYENGEAEEGAIMVYHGSPSGIDTTAQARIEGNVDYRNLGHAVASAGDVNGDGYSDMLTSAIWYSNGQGDEGAVWVYHGNESGSAINNNMKLYNPDMSTVINTSSIHDATFGASLFSKSFLGRTFGKLVWEVRSEGAAFSTSGGSITNSTAYTGQEQAFRNLGRNGTEMKDTVTKVKAAIYNRVRTRVRYTMTKAITGQVLGPWRYMPVHQAGGIGHGLTPLPVSWLGYHITQEQCSNVLHWEIDPDPLITGFTVYFSADGTRFKEISRINAWPGTGMYSVAYEQSERGIYKVSATTRNGQESYFITETEDIPCARLVTGHISAVPNPTAGATRIVADIQGRHLLKGYSLLSSEGTVVAERTLNTVFADTYNFDLPSENLPSGIYLLHILVDNTIYDLKIVRL